MDILMPEGEILQLFREAKNKSKEITILADMNCCKSSEMRDWLIEHGADVPVDMRYKKCKKENKSMAENREIPESIKNFLNDRRRYLIKQIKNMQKEVDDINNFIGPYNKEDKND